MFSKIKQGFDRKSKRVVALMLAASMLCGIAGCSKRNKRISTESNDTSLFYPTTMMKPDLTLKEYAKPLLLMGKLLKSRLN